MHIVSRATLILYWEKHSNSKIGLKLWYQKIINGKWKNINELKNDFPYADYFGNNRVVFNIKGNNFRLITIVFFDGQKIYIRFIGTHAEYDKINAKII